MKFVWRLHLGFILCLSVIGLAATLSSPPLAAQSTTSGDVAGTITDPSGAVIPGAAVVIKNNATGASKSVSANANGAYRIPLLTPGTYTVTARATGFSPRSLSVSVAVGQVMNASLRLQVGGATQTVTVTAEAAPVQTDNANVTTTFSPEQVALLPNPGGDITQTVQTAPGTVMNTQAGYGNFSTFGLPATSNLFTINGSDDNDPFLNVNNSGATNLLLGQNDVQTVSVTNNGYSGQFGELGGANVNYVSKSGGNDWHGNAIYDWNGRDLNANNFFNNANGVSRAFDNANQWAASFGGPIVKDKTFFFVDTEGLAVVLPTNAQALVPSSAFQTATLANLAATGDAAQIPFYQSMFALYNAAPGIASAKPVPQSASDLAGGFGGGCGGASFIGLASGAACADEFQSNASNYTHEWNLAARLDQVLGANDKVFFQFSTDHGVQATYTDPISPSFNISSNQPQYQGQLNWSHSLGASAVNQLVASSQYYSAIFGTDPASRSSVYPASLNFSGGEFTALGGEDYFFPQGRNVSQFGLVDDYSLNLGAQTFKLGANYKLNYVNDYDFGTYTTPFIDTSLSSFFGGTADALQQSFPTNLNQPIRVYTLGAYAEDDIRVNSHLHLTLAMRAEHDSNPICTHDCISRPYDSFTDLPMNPATPYDDIIEPSLAQAYPAYRHIFFQPRFGFAWTPFHNQQTVLRGGFGIFNDLFPTAAVDGLAENAPLDNTFVVSGPLSPAAAGSVFSMAPASNTAFKNAFYSGGTLASITAVDPSFAPPNLYNTDPVVVPPRYQEWNLEIERAIGRHSSFDINYVGNHGIHETVENEGYNAYFPGFAGLPATAPDPAFGTVTQLQPMGTSNYNGMVVSYNQRMSAGFQWSANYTWSHTLDDVSNGGFLPFNDHTNTSILGVQDPYDVFGYNYGNADYDIRNYFSLNYLWQVPFNKLAHWGGRQAWQGWTVSGTLFTRSGLPYTPIDGLAGSTLEGFNDGPQDAIFANQIAYAPNPSCTVDAQCANAANYSPATAAPTGFGNQMRNQLRGPNFFDTDLSLTKNTQIPGWEKAQLGIGFQFYNLLNHPNFDQPVGDISNSQFGTVINTASVPTSIVGSFLGGDASPRMIQFTAKLTF